MSSSESTTERAGWLRLGDLAIGGDGGVCVTSLIKDKIREYMLNEEQQQTHGSPPSKSGGCDSGGGGGGGGDGGGGTCVRRIGNSLDLLLRDSRNAGHAVAVATAKNRSSPSTAATAAAASSPTVVGIVSDATADDHGVSTTISAPADSSRPLPPLPPTFTKRYLSIEDEMQISRMPIPADDCANSEMSVDSNASDTKSDLETTTKMNGDGLQKRNGTTADEADEASEVLLKDEVIEVKSEKLEADKVEKTAVIEEETKEVESEKKTESLSKNTDQLVKNGKSELAEEHESENNIEVVTDTNSDKNENIRVDKNKHKDGTSNDEEEIKPMEIDETEDKLITNVIIKKEPEDAQFVEDTVTQVVEKLNNGDTDHSNEVIKNDEEDVNPMNGDAKHLDAEKSIKFEKVSQKVTEEEDMLSEVSVDTLSPKQNDEPITARKRSAASHDELSVISGASSDNDLPKTKKLRSDEETPLLKDDTRERLIKNIVQSSSKNEVELSRNIEKIQNEIKVITEIAQTKRDELVTLIRLQKLKEEIIERLMIKVKEFDAIKTDNSKDWNLPEMFQINLSQPEHILSEKNISDIIENREIQHEKSSINSYDQNSYATTSATSITPVAPTPNEWILSDRVNRANRIQRPILPKPLTANNHKEGRQGPILDVKLIIADHRSKNPETAVTKRGRRKVVSNDFSVPTSSAPLRYPNPIGFGNPIHHTSDGNFKTTVTNTHGVLNNVMEHGSENNRFKDVPAFPEVTLHPVSQPMQLQQQQQQQQQTSLLHGILTKGAGTHHLPLSMANPPTNYSPTLARLLTAPERCKQTRGKRQTPTATVVSSNTQSRNEITITPVQSTSMSSTFHQKPSITSNIPPAPVDDEDASDRLVIDEGQDAMNANSPSSAPQCQGCMQKPAQFVCAGCGNQWYCSKDCQIDAWDDHSEVCSG